MSRTFRRGLEAARGSDGEHDTTNEERAMKTTKRTQVAVETCSQTGYTQWNSINLNLSDVRNPSLTASQLAKVLREGRCGNRDCTCYLHMPHVAIIDHDEDGNRQHVRCHLTAYALREGGYLTRQ